MGVHEREIKEIEDFERGMEIKMKTLAVLGSTGSIGTQTLDIVREYSELKVEALAVYSQIDLLEHQIREFHPKLVCVYDKDKALKLRDKVKDLTTKVTYGMDGLIECATLDSVDCVVAAVVGMIGIKPTIEAIKAGKDIALANKETLVTAGHIIMPMVKEKKISLLPVDSEHSAIFQSLQGNRREDVKRILLTASGGPFRGKKQADLVGITPKQALKHPNWAMGAKITIDSATMVNKGLEVIEAKWLFDTDVKNITVVVHPQSVIHSMVEYQDGGVIAQLGVPDMKLPIQYALFYPCRKKLPGVKPLDLFEIQNLTFEKPDLETFTGLKLAYEVGKAGGSLPTVYNAANEWAVAAFLRGDIEFLTIMRMIEASVRAHKKIENPSLEDILNTEQETYDFIKCNF